LAYTKALALSIRIIPDLQGSPMDLNGVLLNVWSASFKIAMEVPSYIPIFRKAVYVDDVHT